MKLGTKKHGQALVKREFKETGKNARHIPEVNGLKSGEETFVVGPFSVAEVHANVGSDLRVTLSENYHSVALGVHITIPVDANEKAIEEGLEWTRDKCDKFMNREMKGARAALRALAGR